MGLTDQYKILTGDCVEQMQTLPDTSVHTCVTSPPYFGLRDYGTAKWEGGDSECPHRIPATGSTQNKGNNNKEGTPFCGVCGVCGARRIDNQIGLETTVEGYVAKMVEVFHEVRRTLRDDGTVWLNLGDSYNAQPNQRKTTDKVGAKQETNAGSNSIGSRSVSSLKPKDLCGIPWRVAFALQADGWYLRQDIIWAKPNPMPESVRDRCTKSHEYIFLLSKSPRYYFDIDAIKEPAVCGFNGSKFTEGKTAVHQGNRASQKPRKQDQVGKRTYTGFNDQYAESGPIEMRQKRDVWTVTTKPFKGAHFATFPPDLIEPCILAGAPVGGTVLDPFGGSGTTAVVALKNSRKAILCELNPEYVKMAEKRIAELEWLY